MELSKIEPLPDPHARGRIRLVLLDDHLLFRESLARLLSTEDDFELVAEYTTPSEALKNLKRPGVDVVLADIGIANEFLPWFQKLRHPGKCLVIARELHAAGSALVLKCGAAGIFLASDSASRLMQAIRLVASGEAWVDQKVVQLLAERYPHFEARWPANLTEREQAVLRGVVDGLSNKKIGGQIGVSESTIKAAVQQLFKKAGVRTRSQLVRIALEGPSAANGTRAHFKEGLDTAPEPHEPAEPGCERSS
ncbi:MAG TPA: response regulator transcription factor [Bryobacteraceae bacterium]|nr:response regulator transcription factor [Bryobacteraceae bacterium]